MDMDSMQSVISVNLEWKDFSRQEYNPFEKLFDLKEVQALANYSMIVKRIFTQTISDVYSQSMRNLKRR